MPTMKQLVAAYDKAKAEHDEACRVRDEVLERRGDLPARLAAAEQAHADAVREHRMNSLQRVIFPECAANHAPPDAGPVGELREALSVHDEALRQAEEQVRATAPAVEQAEQEFARAEFEKREAGLAAALERFEDEVLVPFERAKAACKRLGARDGWIQDRKFIRRDHHGWLVKTGDGNKRIEAARSGAAWLQERLREARR